MPPRGPGRPGRKSGAADDDSVPLADRLSFTALPRPFKNPHPKPSTLPYKTASTTRKTAKQILILERERVSGGDGFLTAAQTAARARGEVLEIGAVKKKKEGGVPYVRGANLKGRGKKKEVEEVEAEELGQDEDGEGGKVEEGVKAIVRDVITYHTPTAPPSLLPNKKYCDITGLHASYTDPRTKLRYKGLDVYHVVRSLGPGVDQAYLSLRNAQTSLK